MHHAFQEITSQVFKLWNYSLIWIAMQLQAQCFPHMLNAFNMRQPWVTVFGFLPWYPTITDLAVPSATKFQFLKARFHPIRFIIASDNCLSMLHRIQTPIWGRMTQDLFFSSVQRTPIEQRQKAIIAFPKLLMTQYIFCISGLGPCDIPNRVLSSSFAMTWVRYSLRNNGN